MLYALTATLLLAATGYGAVQISLHPPGTSDPNVETCAAAHGVDLEISPTILTYTDKVTPCIYGSLTVGQIYATTWMHGEDELIRSVQTFTGVIDFGRLTGGKQSFDQIFRNVIVDQLGANFQIPITVSVYTCSQDCEFGDLDANNLIDSATLLMNRPEQEVGYEAHNLFNIRASKPNKIGQCKHDDDSTAINNAIANGEPIFICIIFMCPFAENTELAPNSGKNSYSTITTIEVNGEVSEFTYDESQNKRLSYEYVEYVVPVGINSLTVTATMDSFDGVVLTESENHDFTA